jgi:hypothetical protein
LVCANDGAIDDRAHLINLPLQSLEDELPTALLRPVRKPIVGRLPTAEALRQVSPRHARFRPEEHGLDEQSVTSHRLRASLLLWQNCLQASPLILGQRVSMHGES